MNRALLIMAALLPFAATAGAGGSLQNKVDVQKLQQDTRASEVIGADVPMQGAEESGSVEDIELSRDGRIQAVLIDGLDQQQRQQDQRASTQGSSQGGNIGTQTEDGLTKVQWQQVQYDPQQQTLRLTSSGQQGMSASGSQSQQQASTRQSSGVSSEGMRASSQSQSQPAQQGSMDQSRASTGGDSFRVSEVVGMEVHLSDAASFGEVEDVLIDRQQGKASALLVDAWEGFDKQTYALPVELSKINREDNTLTYSYTESDVVALQEYEEQ